MRFEQTEQNPVSQVHSRRRRCRALCRRCSGHNEGRWRPSYDGGQDGQTPETARVLYAQPQMRRDGRKPNDGTLPILLISLPQTTISAPTDRPSLFFCPPISPQNSSRPARPCYQGRSHWPRRRKPGRTALINLIESDRSRQKSTSSRTRA